MKKKNNKLKRLINTLPDELIRTFVLYNGNVNSSVNRHTIARQRHIILSPISLGRPEIFEKVAKTGVGVHIWLLQVSKLTQH